MGKCSRGCFPSTAKLPQNLQFLFRDGLQIIQFSCTNVNSIRFNNLSGSVCVSESGVFFVKGYFYVCNMLFWFECVFGVISICVWMWVSLCVWCVHNRPLYMCSFVSRQYTVASLQIKEGEITGMLTIEATVMNAYNSITINEYHNYGKLSLFRSSPTITTLSR